MNITVLPAGAWGTALAIHLSRQGHAVTLVPRSLEDAVAMARERQNSRHLAGCTLPADLQIGLELAPAMMEAEVVLFACPSRHLRAVAERVQRARRPADGLKVAVSLSKGLEAETHLFPTEVLRQSLEGVVPATLSGPSFASQVAEGKPTAVVLATEADAAVAERLQQGFSGDSFRVYTSQDVAGVELGGCLKNVYAIAAGMCDGLGLGDNSKAALLTRSLHEMVRLGVALGGKPETFYGLSGLGDLVLTCNGGESRNRTFGEDLARHGLEGALRLHGDHTVEGCRSAACFSAICSTRGLEAPILEVVHRAVRGQVSAAAAVSGLMGRRLKAEHL